MARLLTVTRTCRMQNRNSLHYLSAAVRATTPGCFPAVRSWAVSGEKYLYERAFGASA